MAVSNLGIGPWIYPLASAKRVRFSSAVLAQFPLFVGDFDKFSNLPNMMRSFFEPD